MEAIMERADENLLPAVYKEVSETFKAGPSDLLSHIQRNFFQGITSPVEGILVINYDCPTVLAIGILCCSLSSGAVGASKYFMQVGFWRAVNGFGLAIVIPALQSFIADSYMDESRGTGVGFLSLVGTVGGLGGGAIATVMAGYKFWGIRGWCFAFVMMATFSVFIAFLVFKLVVDPRKRGSTEQDTAKHRTDREDLIEKQSTNSMSIWMESWTSMKAVMKVQTFQFDHKSAAALVSLFAAGCAIGSFLGGVVADKISCMYPHSGCIMCATCSAFMGIPFSCSYCIFSVILFLVGMTISFYRFKWSHVRRSRAFKHRTMIYAFDCAFEVLFSSFTAPVSVDPVLGSVKEALALSKGLFSMIALPFGLCCLFYTPLYWTFKQDRENARLTSINETELI
ncbi:unnamed protein product [Withania somnifera]